MKKVIIIVGMPGSGKSLGANILGKKLKAKPVHSGNIIRDEIKKRGWKYTPETDRKIQTYFHSKGREKLLIKKLWSKVKKKKGNIIIEGMRSPKQLRYLRKHTDYIIVAVKSPFVIRAKRAMKRKRFGVLQTMKYLRQRDKNETNLGVRKLINIADYKISNKTTKKRLENKLSRLAKQLR